MKLMTNHREGKTYMKPGMLLSLVVLSTVLTSGCVTTPYVAPQSGLLADLAIRIVPTKGTSFTLSIYDNAETCSGAKTMVDDAGKVSISATKLAANKITTFSYYEVQGNLACNVNFSFLPVAGHTYVLDTETGRNRCSYRIVDATDLKRLISVPVIQRTVSGTACAPLKK
ncbi:hypothetical protein [Undibacterium sp. TJN19]|uniref:hypothetical protein n=1 Tax=Undibacterium sp. TJN19 TaxID=3413055 RepID=UPI003BEF6DE8